jgi:hypothetical protein
MAKARKNARGIANQDENCRNKRWSESMRFSVASTTHPAGYVGWEQLK